MAFRDCNGKFNIWRIVIGTALMLLMSAGGWALSEVRDFPVHYVTKSKHVADLKSIQEQADIHKQELDTKIDNVKEELSVQQTRIEDKVDETNQFLRNYFSTH